MWPSVKAFAVLVVCGVPAALVGIPWSMLRGNVDAMYGWAMGTIRLGLRAAGITVHVEGLEHVPHKPSVIMSNHVSNLDPPVLLPCVPGQTSVMLKQSLMRIPLLGVAMRLGKFVPVSRGHSREEAVRSVAAAADALRSGKHITIFPEGTRSPDGQLLPFRKGAFFLAAETGAPIVPVVLYGTARMLPRDSKRLVPGAATVRFLPAHYPENYPTRDLLMQAVRQAMETALASGPSR